jgi:hypothetical protein
MGPACVILTSVAVLGVAYSAPRGDDGKSSTEKFQPRLLEIARDYTSFGRVDDQYRWAPHLCRTPSPAAVRFSASKETTTHGQKLYSLFAKDRTTYLAHKDQPVGQVLVKQSWEPREIADKGQALAPVIRRVKDRVQVKGQKAVAVEHYDSFLPYARKNGKLYHAEKQADLFIMYKVDPATPGTDKGWVYGTVTADGKQVTSAGRVASCVKCHEQAKSDRLFGLPER